MLGVLRQEDKGASKAREDRIQQGFGWAAQPHMYYCSTQSSTYTCMRGKFSYVPELCMIYLASD